METQCHTLDENTATSLRGFEYYYAHRPEFLNALKLMATRTDGPGTPVSIHLKEDVTAYVSPRLSCEAIMM
jgi:hypothetical protein